MNKTELKALIKEAFLTEKKNTLLNENAPGFDNRKQGEALPTLESVKAAYEAKKLEEAVQSTKEEKIKHIESKFGHLDTIRKGKFTVEEENGHFTFTPDSFEELASDNDEEADDQGGSQILKQIEAAINETVEEITTVTKMTKPAEAAEIAKAEGTPKTTVDAAIKKAKTSGKDVSIAEDALEEDRFVDSSLEDLRQVVRNLAHTAGMGIEEAAEMAIMHIQDMFMGGEEEEDMMQEGTPTVFDDKSMDDLLNIILKYVKDPADAEKELERFDAGGFEAMSDSVQSNLDRDKEYKAWYNKLHSIKEGVEKDYWADYTDIGMFYIGIDAKHSLSDHQLEKLGEKIVKQLYGGDVGKAYDDIVRGKKRGAVADSAEGEKNESIKVATESFTDPLEGFPQSYKDLLNKLQRSNDRSERDMLINKMNVIRKKHNLKPLKNESVIAEADMIVESFRTRK
jgi:sugar-specific transcriptional regulator TrmB